jgi:hypothetical protein
MLVYLRGCNTQHEYNTCDVALTVLKDCHKSDAELSSCRFARDCARGTHHREPLQTPVRKRHCHTHTHNTHRVHREALPSFPPSLPTPLAVPPAPPRIFGPLSLSQSLTLSHTHTRTHTHTLSLSPAPPRRRTWSRRRRRRSRGHIARHRRRPPCRRRKGWRPWRRGRGGGGRRRSECRRWGNTPTSGARIRGAGSVSAPSS